MTCRKCCKGEPCWLQKTLLRLLMANTCQMHVREEHARQNIRTVSEAHYLGLIDDKSSNKATRSEAWWKDAVSQLAACEGIIGMVRHKNSLIAGSQCHGFDRVYRVSLIPISHPKDRKSMNCSRLRWEHEPGGECPHRSKITGPPSAQQPQRNMTDHMLAEASAGSEKILPRTVIEARGSVIFNTFRRVPFQGRGQGCHSTRVLLRSMV